MSSLFAAKLCLLGVLATFIPLFVGWPRNVWVRRGLFAALVVLFGAMFALSVNAVGSRSQQFDRLGGQPTALAAAGAAAVLFMAALTWLAYRYPTIAICALVALLPIRLPLPLGGGASNLLVPLYLLTLAIALAEIVVRDRLAVPDGFRRDPTRLALAAVIAVSGVSVLWVGLKFAVPEKAYANAMIKLFAFYVPFAAVFYLVVQYVGSRLRLQRILTVFLGAGIVLSIVGLVQVPTHWVIFNRDVIMRNEELQGAFRVNSLFWDPNMFSRFCALVALVGVAVFLAFRHVGYEAKWRRALPLTAAALAATLATTAYIFTFSRTGLISLVVGAVIIELAWLGWKKGLIAVLVTALVLAGGLYGITRARHAKHVEVKLSTTIGLNKLTGGRVFLIKGGWRMFRRHPLTGVGLGAFPQAFPKYRTSHGARLTLRESHTTPVTVAAELGVAGLIPYAALLVAFFATTLHRRRFGAARDLYLLQAGIVAAVATITVASLSYNAYFEDPYLWLFLGLGVAGATRLAPGRARERAADATAVSADEASASTDQTPDDAGPLRASD